jgi:hypothetical protein
MALKFNPFTGTLDQTGSGGGASYIDGEVQNFSALPETIGTPAVDSAYLVREAEGTWLLARKPAGIYIRTADTGVRAADWTHASAFPDVFSDAAFTVFSDGDSTKNLQLSLSGITTGTTRTLTAPNKSGTIALTTDIPSVNDIELETDGTTTITTAQLPARGIAYAPEGESTYTVNLPTPDIRQSGLTFSLKTEYEEGTGTVFVTVVHAAVNLLTTYELDEDEGSIDFVWDGYAWRYDTAYLLRSFPSRVLQLPAASGTIARTEDFASPPAIGNTTPNTLAGTQLALHDGSDTGTFVAASKLTANRTYDLPDASGTIALTSQITKTYAVFTATDNQPPATAYATLDTRNSIAVLDFDDATDESAVFVSIIPEAASLGSGLKIRLHWMATTATSGDVVWDVSLERMTTDLDSDSFDTIASGTAAANGTSGILTVTEITLTTIDSVTAGDGYRLKITRDADNGSDSMSGDAELVVCEVRSAA